MAQRDQLDQEFMSCFICLNLLKDPVMVPCGHIYCRDCIKTQGDKGEERIFSCPQCRQTFTLVPAQNTNSPCAGLVAKMEKVALQDPPADHCYAGPGDITCDVCTERKLKASKSCLFCLISFCEIHLQPHYQIPAYAKHKLVEPSKMIQESICPHHGEVMKMFCRTDQKSICYLCPVDEHKGHYTVSAAAERTERQKDLEVSRQKIHQRIQEREKDVELLQQEVEAINQSADQAVGNSELIFKELICLMEKRCSDMKQEVRLQQERQVSQVRELQGKFKQEILELKRKDTELEEISHTQGLMQFLQDYSSKLPLWDLAHSSSINIRPMKYFDDVTVALSGVRDQIQNVLSEKWTKISNMMSEVDVLLLQPELKSRDEFLQFSQDITLDPNTASEWLMLSEFNRKATLQRKQRLYPEDSETFNDNFQVLSKESLKGRCYWEVEWRGEGVCIAVAYKTNSGAWTSTEPGFGHSDNSYSLDCFPGLYNFWYDNVLTPVSGPPSSKIGVFLDHNVGSLSFYSVFDDNTMSLLHRVQTTFSKPLYVGLGIYSFTSFGSSVKLCKLK